MALPRQVAAQLREVEELEKTLTAQTKSAESDEKEEAVEELDTKAKDQVEEPKAEAKPEEAKPADAKPTEVTDGFEQKYKTLRGKYDAEVPRLHQQVKELTEQLDMFQKELNALKKPNSEKPKEKVSYVTDADRAEFGEELIDVQRRVAREVASEYEARLEQQEKVIEDLRSQIANTGNQVGEMNFAQRLQRLVPDFEQINADDRWVAWLNEYDPMLRGPRRDQAQAAFNTGDAEAVADYVKLFKATLEPVESTAKAARQTELVKQVAPNRSANSVSSQGTGRDVKVYSEREINNAWNKIRILNSRGQYDDAAKLEAEITAAYIEGRVRS